MQPGQLYALFDRAETLGMTVHKLLTGKDAPLLHIEMVLANTFAQARHYLEGQRQVTSDGL